VMYGYEKSDFAIVATKLPNKAGQPAAEAMERRAGTKGNTGQQSTRRTQIRESVSQALERVRNAARQRKKEKFTALLHHISIDQLEVAFLELQEDAAAGVDGLTWRVYEADLKCKLEDLHSRLPEERTGRCHHGGSTSRSRMGGSDRSRLPHWKIKLSNGQQWRC